MEKTYLIFKKFIPYILILSAIGLLFGIFSLAYSYNDATISVVFTDVIPVFWLIFLGFAYIVAFIFTFRVKSLHIRRIKKSSSFSKFAAILAAGLVTALFLFNFFQFVQQESLTLTFKNIRLIFSVPFIAYLVIGVIPKKIKRKPVNIPKWLLPVSAVSTLAWCILSILAIYFWSGIGALPTTNFFRLAHLLYLVVATLFFLAEIGFEMFSKGHRFYVLTASCLFITTIVFTGSITIAMFFGRLAEVTISPIEIFVGVALGIYALSKLFAMQYTMKHVMKQQQNGHRHRHHHHHHHHSSDKSTKVAKSKSTDIPADIDI